MIKNLQMKAVDREEVKQPEPESRPPPQTEPTKASNLYVEESVPPPSQPKEESPRKPK